MDSGGKCFDLPDSYRPTQGLSAGTDMAHPGHCIALHFGFRYLLF